MSRFAVILPAAGRSSRFGDPRGKKPFVPLAGRAVWLHAAERFRERDDVRQLIVAISPEDRNYFEQEFGEQLAKWEIEVIDGGAERADSVERALIQVRPEIEFVAVHDAARPCLSISMIDALFAEALRSGAAILAIPVANTLKRVSAAEVIEETVPRAGLWEAQTPQVFRRELLVEAFARRAGFSATDEAQLMERIGHAVSVVRGSPSNLKITTQDDLLLAELILQRSSRGTGT